jgi:hypothetical protein
MQGSTGEAATELLPKTEVEDDGGILRKTPWRWGWAKTGGAGPACWAAQREDVREESWAVGPEQREDSSSLFRNFVFILFPKFLFDI